MTARRVDNTEFGIARFDVLGRDSESAPRFVRHLALSNEAHTALKVGTEVAFTHMRPPLRIGSDKRTVDCAGSVPLKADEIRQIGVFIDELDQEYKAQRARPRDQYVIRPHVVPFRDRGTVLFQRFSCAGFVIEAHREAGIDLLQTDDASLPRIDLATLRNAYPDAGARLDDPAFRAENKLDGDGPWPVVLPGHVLHSLKRDVAAIRAAPHRASQGEEFFA